MLEGEKMVPGVWGGVSQVVPGVPSGNRGVPWVRRGSTNGTG